MPCSCCHGFVGFAPTYYLAGVFHAPLPSLIIHLHGPPFPAGFSARQQTSLVAAGRTDIHRRSALQASSWRVSWFLAFWQPPIRLSGKPARGQDPKFFYIIPLSNMVILRRHLFAFRAALIPAHKRLIFVGTVH